MKKPIFVTMAFFVFVSTANLRSYGAVMTFDDIAAGTEFDVGETIVSGGIEILVGGNPATNTSTRVIASNLAGGTGNELHSFADRELIFQLAQPFSLVSFKFSNRGGTNFISVNGVTTPNVFDFDALDGLSFGGVNFSSNNSNPQILTMTGQITLLTIAGQELAIDDVTLTPEPSTLTLAALALLSLFAHGRDVERRNQHTYP